MFNVEFRCFLRLRSSKNNSNGGHLRCLSGSVRAGESRDDAGLDRTLLIVAQATSAELELSVYVLGLAQETSEPIFFKDLLFTKQIATTIITPPRVIVVIIAP